LVALNFFFTPHDIVYMPEHVLTGGPCVYSSAAISPKSSGSDRLAPEDIAFARAWEVYAPGLGGWTVQVEDDEDGAEFLLVDPPLVYGDGFTVRCDAAGATISWQNGADRASSVRQAMLKICPLAPDVLAAVENLAIAPSPHY
jgi:hypothetical protein